MTELLRDITDQPCIAKNRLAVFNCGLFILQCFDTVGLAAQTALAHKKTECWGAVMVICPGRGADLHMAQLCHCHSLSVASAKSRLFYRLTWVVLNKGLLHRCCCCFTFMVLAYPGCPGKEAVNRVPVLIL